MVDCGGQGSFINNNFSKQYQLPCRPKSFPVSLVLADGSQSQAGHLTQYNPVLLRTAGNEEPIGLDIAPTSHNIILGMPWLKKHDPAIRFGRQELTFDSPFCQQHCSHYGKTIPLHASPRELGEEEIDKRDESRKVLPPRNLSEVSRAQVQRESPSVDVVDQETPPKGEAPNLAASAHVKTHLPSVTSPPPQPSSNFMLPSACATPPKAAPKRPSSKTIPVFSKPPPVSIVGAHAFAHLCNQPGVQLFTMSFADLAPESVELSSAEVQESDLSLVPEEYRDLTDLFTQKEADKLPPHRPYDHRIPLEPGSTPPFGTIYSMSPAELEILRKYIEDNLRRRFIRHSQSPCGAPILFAKKPDGTLRLCVDYRALNKITTKNRYPLPLIGELLDRISRAKFFTKFDVRDGYHRLRMAEGEEWKTAFRCRYGLFEYNVMPFGLCNAPGTFQHYMNDTFRDFLDKFLIIYLDDLLIYSDTLAEHKKHVRMVLERLQEAGLCLKPSKCQFHVQEVAFLGFLVGPTGVRMDPAKVEAITSWPAPESVHEVRVFLGLANFYRRFIKNFSKMATPMTALLKKNRRFRWTQEAQSSFDELKLAFTTAPILRHFNPSLPTVVEADASDYAQGGVVSQRDPETSELHPIAFWSRKFNTAELNYEIYDKEMLAIVETMGHYRHYFEGLGQQTVIFSDHKNLLWFTETKIYNRRQARWAEKLSRFDFKIVFRPGKQGGKPDALSRRPDYTLGKDASERTMTFLKPEQIDTSLIDPEDPILATYLLNAVDATPAAPENTRAQNILAALDQDPDIGPYLPQIRDPALPRSNGDSPYLRPFSADVQGMVLYNGRVYVPAVDQIKVEILREHHDAKTAGHLGQEKTLELLARSYYWPRMRQFVNEYVNTCETCVRNKIPRHAPFGDLQPLPIPAGPWQSVSMDFIVELPPSDGYDAIFVCVDRLTKMAHFVPTTSDVTAEQAAQLYCQHVWKLHGLPVDTVSDRGSQFVSHFTRHLLKRLDIQGNRSTAYHPQSDGQTERVNQTLEQYLRIYCDYQQDDWHQLLPLAEFVYNNTQNSSTRISPFFANYGYHPRCSVTVANAESTNPAAEALLDRLQAVHTELKVNLQQAQDRYKRQHDRHTRPAPTIAVGDKVWLNRRNIRTTRPSRKLDVKRMGPFQVLEVVGDGKLAYKLELPLPMRRLHPVFHVSLLEPYRENVLPGRVQEPPPPVEVEGEVEYEVAAILDSKIERGKLKYLVDWVNYGPEERTWEPVENVENSPDAIAAFHRAYPLRPSPQDVARPANPPRRRPRRR